MSKRVLLGSALAWSLAAGSMAVAQTIIYDNGAQVPGTGQFGFVTNPGQGFGGANASALTAPNVNFGFSFAQLAAQNFRVAENFTVPAGEVWTVTGMHNFAYLTGAGTATSPIISGNVRFWDNSPALVGSNVIAGDTTTNVLSSSVFSNIWRASSTALTTNNRAVWDNTFTLGAPLVLNPGTYWVDFQVGYTGAVQGFGPPITLNSGSGATGDAIVFNSATNAWTPVVDNTAVAGVTETKGMPFLLVGTIAPIPEPSSMALVGLAGLAGCGWRRWKAKK